MSEGGQTLRRPRSILGPVHDDYEACWRASASRDRRFDGRFFVGVHSTRIYCRPICPAPPAKRENVRFYPTAAAAEAAGLRACRRCRPETAPGTPEWLGGSATVARGLRLIADGYLDRHTVPELARSSVSASASSDASSSSIWERRRTWWPASAACSWRAC